MSTNLINDEKIQLDIQIQDIIDQTEKLEKEELEELEQERIRLEKIRVQQEMIKQNKPPILKYSEPKYNEILEKWVSIEEGFAFNRSGKFIGMYDEQCGYIRELTNYDVADNKKASAYGLTYNDKNKEEDIDFFVLPDEIIFKQKLAEKEKHKKMCTNDGFKAYEKQKLVGSIKQYVSYDTLYVFDNDKDKNKYFIGMYEDDDINREGEEYIRKPSDDEISYAKEEYGLFYRNEEIKEKKIEHKKFKSFSTILLPSIKLQVFSEKCYVFDKNKKFIGIFVSIDGQEDYIRKPYEREAIEAEEIYGIFYDGELEDDEPVNKKTKLNKVKKVIKNVVVEKIIPISEPHIDKKNLFWNDHLNSYLHLKTNFLFDKNYQLIGILGINNDDYYVSDMKEEDMILAKNYNFSYNKKNDDETTNRMNKSKEIIIYTNEVEKDGRIIINNYNPDVLNSIKDNIIKWKKLDLGISKFIRIVDKNRYYTREELELICKELGFKVMKLYTIILKSKEKGYGIMEKSYQSNDVLKKMKYTIIPELRELL